MEAHHQIGELKRGLKNRHIQLIALGGAVGTGLFLGSAGVMKSAGPSMILGYAIGGFIVFLIMRQLGEMIVDEPVAGSFSYFAYKYWGDLPGFMSGWNYWILYVLVGMSELTAVGKYINFWYPMFPTWATAAIFFVLINLINLATVRLYGEFEFWFAIIKVAAILGMIIFGGFLLLSGLGGPQASITNLWQHGGFFPNGVKGLFMVLAIIMFSYGGLELIGITAAEADNPRQTIPKAINQVIYRILIFYIGALVVLLSLTPWDALVASIAEHTSQGDDYGGSPFVIVFSMLGKTMLGGSETANILDFVVLAAHILNFVVLTAALSVYNSCVYCNSRMLYGLAQQGNAPIALTRVDRRGVPLLAIGLSAVCTCLCVLINYILPRDALELLMSLVVAALVINWAMISLAHLKFRRKKDEEKAPSYYFKSLWYPYSNYFCLLFVVLILGIMLQIPEIRISVYAIPVWLIILWFCYRIKISVAKKRKSLN